MRKDAIKIEESRVSQNTAVDFPPFKERHRVFPAIFENRGHRKILDLAAGIGYVTQRVLDNYSSSIISHDISPSCLSHLRQRGAPTLSFDIDNADVGFPFVPGAFDAVISLVTIEHLLFVNEFVAEINRVLCNGGYLYISTPNYAAPEYLVGPLLHGRTFHDPLDPMECYEFYAHVRYFTFKTLAALVLSQGFELETVYVALAGGSDRYMKLFRQSKSIALTFKSLMWLRAKILPPSRLSEPILCFRKTSMPRATRFRKVLL